jgi:type II secretion system protein I
MRVRPDAGPAHARERGLTLVEVLVALAILGLVAASIVALIGQNSRFIADQEEKMLAGMLADAATVEALARASPLERGEEAEERIYGNRTFQVKRVVVDTETPGIVRIETSVRAQDGGQTLAKATTLKKEAS